MNLQNSEVFTLQLKIFFIFCGSQIFFGKATRGDGFMSATFHHVGDHTWDNRRWEYLDYLKGPMSYCAVICLDEPKCYGIYFNAKLHDCRLLPIDSIAMNTATKVPDDDWTHFVIEDVFTKQLPPTFLSTDGRSICMKYKKPYDDISTEDPYLCFKEPRAITKFKNGQTNCTFVSRTDVNCDNNNLETVPNHSNYTQALNRCAYLGCVAALQDSSNWYFKSKSIEDGCSGQQGSGIKYWYPWCR